MGGNEGTGNEVEIPNAQELGLDRWIICGIVSGRSREFGSLKLSPKLSLRASKTALLEPTAAKVARSM
jgi:hypothetical protein